MKSYIVLFLSLFVIMSSFDISAQSRRSNTPAKKIYCYDDAQGRRVCSDTLPADESKNARTEINSRTGIVTREVERAPTQEELEVVKRQEMARLEREKQEAENLRKVDLLIGNFNSEEEIQRSYDVKIDQFNAQINFSQNAMGQIRKTLASQLQRLAEIELNNHKAPQNRVDEMMKTRRAILNHQENIERMKVARKKIEDEKQLAIVTFRQFNNL